MVVGKEHAVSAHHYNPDWLDDDSLLAHFIARRPDFQFLRDELSRIALQGSPQHFLLVGQRGAGKTTLLKRLAVAIRRDADLQDHLLALSFPEELYQVKNLADFWWAACEALGDELERLGHTAQSEQVFQHLDQRVPGINAEPLDDGGLKLLLSQCAALGKRPVLLVDNLDMVFQRIDKTGRKLKDPHAPAYWVLREALSTTRSPIVIGGSVRLSEPFTDYDKAFYDFFSPKRLGKLSLNEVNQVLEHLAEVQQLPEVKQRLKERPSRVEALHELTGGNPRALGLIFQLLRQGANSRAVQDFEQLMDITTPYYKARFEDLSEQAQVVMHALAVRRPGEGGLRFGHTAAEIGQHAGLPTSTVSTQLDILEREGVVEKNASHGRTQYRIAEQLFRLWLQMRSTRRVRQNVIGLTEFLQALFDREELQNATQNGGADSLSEAKLAFAVANIEGLAEQRRGLEALGTERVAQYVRAQGACLEEYLQADDLPPELAELQQWRKQLRQHAAGLTQEQQHALLGSLTLKREQKQAAVAALCGEVSRASSLLQGNAEPSRSELARDLPAPIQQQLQIERQNLLRLGLLESDLPLLYERRSLGYLPLPDLTPADAEAACQCLATPEALRSLVWRLVGARRFVTFAYGEKAEQWLQWGKKYCLESGSPAWANVAGGMRRSKQFEQAEIALKQAFDLGESSRAWGEKGVVLAAQEQQYRLAEEIFHKAIGLDPRDALPWYNLGYLLVHGFERFVEAESAYRKAIDLDPSNALIWQSLGYLLMDKLERFSDAEHAYHRALEFDPDDALSWHNLGRLLAIRGDLEAAVTAFARGAGLDRGLYPSRQELRTETVARFCAQLAQPALDRQDEAALTQALSRLTQELPDPADALVTTAFVEGFLGEVLAQAPQGELLLRVLRAQGFDRYARPLLLAFDAALHQRADMLDELEPELQTATKILYQRIAVRRV